MDIKTIITEALKEDLGDRGDITTDSICDPNDRTKAQIVVKADGVLCGLEVARDVFLSLDPQLSWESHFKDGDTVRGRVAVATFEGMTCSILAGERTALNFMQRMSGIATTTALFVRQTGGKAIILDTRKTVPLLRDLDKYAVKTGGGENHRMGLHDLVMIKDNHIALAGSVAHAVERVRVRHGNVKIEAEAKSMEQVKELVTLQVDMIQLDNMSVVRIKEAVDYIRSQRSDIKVEASGGVTLVNIPDIAETGVDYISVGALTHSAPALDISLDIL